MTSGEHGHPSDGEARHPEEAWALGAAVVLLAITWLWWAFALWPVDASAEWLTRARNVCFGVGPSGMPDAGGWILLIGQPLGMAGVLVVGWRRELARGMARTVERWSGRALVSGCAAAIAGNRV